VNRSTIVRSGACPLFANHRASDSGYEELEGRYFKPFRGIILCEAMKRYGIKFDVLIDPCVGPGCFLAKHIDVIARCLRSRRQHFDLFPRTGILKRQGSAHRKLNRI
jgi:hypothetical protein